MGGEFGNYSNNNKIDFCEGEGKKNGRIFMWKISLSFFLPAWTLFFFLSFSRLVLAGFSQPQNSIHALCLTLVYEIES